MIDNTIEVSVTFFSHADGGRTDGNPANLSGNIYRPHLIVGGSKDRIGVMFDRGPEKAIAGHEHQAVVTVIFQSRDALPVAASFTIYEGPRAVGSGKVERWVS